MLVRTLIHLLKSCNPDATVMVSSDAEGNQIQELRDLETDEEESKTVVLWP